MGLCCLSPDGIFPDTLLKPPYFSLNILRVTHRTHFKTWSNLMFLVSSKFYFSSRPRGWKIFVLRLTLSMNLRLCPIKKIFSLLIYHLDSRFLLVPNLLVRVLRLDPGSVPCKEKDLVLRDCDTWTDLKSSRYLVTVDRRRRMGRGKSYFYRLHQ